MTGSKYHKRGRYLDTLVEGEYAASWLINVNITWVLPQWLISPGFAPMMFSKNPTGVNLITNNINVKHPILSKFSLRAATKHQILHLSRLWLSDVHKVRDPHADPRAIVLFKKWIASRGGSRTTVGKLNGPQERRPNNVSFCFGLGGCWLTSRF